MWIKAHPQHGFFVSATIKRETRDSFRHSGTVRSVPSATSPVRSSAASVAAANVVRQDWIGTTAMKISDLMPPAARELVATSRFTRSFYCDRRMRSLLTDRNICADAGVARQSAHRSSFLAVVIVENDAVGRESVPVATSSLRRIDFAGLCVVEPRQGNCHAINAAFETALASFPTAAHFLMIDDDEIASADWLELMVRASEITGTGMVSSPVLQNFDDEMKRGLQRHPAFLPAYDTSGPVPVAIYGSGNCLITRPVFTGLSGSPPSICGLISLAAAIPTSSCAAARPV